VAVRRQVLVEPAQQLGRRRLAADDAQQLLGSVRLAELLARGRPGVADRVERAGAIPAELGDRAGDQRQGPTADVEAGAAVALVALRVPGQLEQARARDGPLDRANSAGGGDVVDLVPVGQGQDAPEIVHSASDDSTQDRGRAVASGAVRRRRPRR
jgi:hypothetical protein